MSTHSPLPVGAIKTKVLILLIVLIVCGVAGTVIFTHLLKPERKPDATATTPRAQPANLYRSGLNIFEQHWKDVQTQV